MVEAWLEGLVGRSVSRSDVADAHRWAAYHSYFDLDAELDRPLALHWLLFTELRPDIRADGHPRVMEPFPELPFPRRMWAGGEIAWTGRLAEGEALRRETMVTRAEPKEGKVGRFLLTSVRQSVSIAGRGYVDERQDVVFLPAESRPGGGAKQPLAWAPDWREARDFGPVALFRYSALTFNSHRIHYDAPYAREVEGYQGLVVHGPLLASHLMHAAARRRPQAPPAQFAYRSVAPLLAGETCSLVGRTGEGADELAVLGPDDGLRMTATMRFGEG